MIPVMILFRLMYVWMMPVWMIPVMILFSLMPVWMIPVMILFKGCAKKNQTLDFFVHKSHSF